MLKSQKRKFTAILEPAEEGGYIAKCAELPVATEGETRSEAVRNITEAVEGYLEVRAGLLGRSKAKKQLVEIAVKQATGPLLGIATPLMLVENDPASEMACRETFDMASRLL